MATTWSPSGCRPDRGERRAGSGLSTSMRSSARSLPASAATHLATIGSVLPARRTRISVAPGDDVGVRQDLTVLDTMTPVPTASPVWTATVDVGGDRHDAGRHRGARRR